MTQHLMSVGYMPLVDSAPLIVAHELGFAAEEGLTLDLQKAATWALLRDLLALEKVDAAHMLAPVPISQAMGLGGSARFDALAVLSRNGTVVGASRELAARMHDNGLSASTRSAADIGHALVAARRGTIRIGVPFPFSMHAELLYYWLSSVGLPAPQGVEIRTVPPRMMSDAIAAGDIDVFCVGEPWGSLAVESGEAELILPGASIWAAAPEKVLAVRKGWTETAPERSRRLIRAVWKAGKWLDRPENHMVTAEILSRPGYLDISADIIDRALSGDLVTNRSGGRLHSSGFMAFHNNMASFPWKSQAAWIGHQIASRVGLDRLTAERTASDVFRTDIFRAALADEAHALPPEDSKIEGAAHPGLFFDGRIFDIQQNE
ncbi:CmpA/NrtA family ABC transporter substrate-binding protein [Loktanella agnita]|uniref:CmpA/NrtA family ABC transporter substrate-binding protein n=1 Tax=Loktanella agnita TaxID=287097 RepID=UPI003986429A